MAHSGNASAKEFSHSAVQCQDVRFQPPYTAYVGNIPPDTEIKDSVFGSLKIREVRWVRSARLKDVCFIDFDDYDSLEAALKLNGESIGGRKIKVERASAKGSLPAHLIGVGSVRTYSAYDDRNRGHEHSEFLDRRGRASHGHGGFEHAQSFQSQQHSGHRERAPPGPPARRGLHENADDSRFQCFGCGGTGHRVRDCPNPQANLTCHKCGVRGHIARCCTTAASHDGRQHCSATVDVYSGSAESAALGDGSNGVQQCVAVSAQFIGVAEDERSVHATSTPAVELQDHNGECAIAQRADGVNGEREEAAAAGAESQAPSAPSLTTMVQFGEFPPPFSSAISPTPFDPSVRPPPLPSTSDRFSSLVPNAQRAAMNGDDGYGRPPPCVQFRDSGAAVSALANGSAGVDEAQDHQAIDNHASGGGMLSKRAKRKKQHEAEKKRGDRSNEVVEKFRANAYGKSAEDERPHGGLHNFAADARSSAEHSNSFGVSSTNASLPECGFSPRRAVDGRSFFDCLAKRDVHFGDELNDIARLLAHEQPSSSTSSGDQAHLGFYSGQHGALKLLETASNVLSNDGLVDSSAAVALWSGKLPQVLRAAVEKNELDDFLLALAPLAGGETMRRYVCLAYAKQLVAQREYQKAATCYLAVGRVEDAINLLNEHACHRDAIVLARARLSSENELLKKLYRDWAQFSLDKNRYVHAAKCYLAIDDYTEAARLLGRNGRPFSARLLAIECALKAPESPLVRDLVASAICDAMKAGSWALAYEIPTKSDALKDWSYLVAVFDCLLSKWRVLLKGVRDAQRVYSMLPQGSARVNSQKLCFSIPHLIWHTCKHTMQLSCVCSSMIEQFGGDWMRMDREFDEPIDMLLWLAPHVANVVLMWPVKPDEAKTLLNWLMNKAKMFPLLADFFADCWNEEPQGAASSCCAAIDGFVLDDVAEGPQQENVDGVASTEYAVKLLVDEAVVITSLVDDIARNEEEREWESARGDDERVANFIAL